jgi:hypothetical protein
LDQLEKIGIADHIGLENIFPAQPLFGDSLMNAYGSAQS